MNIIVSSRNHDKGGFDYSLTLRTNFHRERKLLQRLEQAMKNGATSIAIEYAEDPCYDSFKASKRL